MQRNCLCLPCLFQVPFRLKSKLVTEGALYSPHAIGRPHILIITVQNAVDQEQQVIASEPETSATNVATGDQMQSTNNAATESAASDAATSDAAASDTAGVTDAFEPYRKKQRNRENVQARVVKWQRNGLEMELEDGTRAFMPNDMIDRDPNRNIANYFGKTLQVRITSVKPLPGKTAEITVSHRAVIDDELRTQGKERVQDLNIGDVVEVKVKSFNNQGVVVDMGAGVDATIRARDLSWEKFDHPYEVVKRGQDLQAKILQIDKGRRRVILGVKQLTPDPYLSKIAGFEKGQTVKGTVTKINDFGAEIELEPNVIAFLPISEISWKRINKVSDAVQQGEELELKIITADTEERKLTVSLKQMSDNPLKQIEATYKLNSDHNGVIKEINRGGVVVTLEHNAEGFVPRRELSHDRIERLEDQFKVGTTLENLRVIEYDRRNGKITMSLIAAEREAQRNTLKDYRATSKASSFTLGDLASLKEKLERIERGS